MAKIEFTKYPSIINEYKIGDIEYWIDKHPELIDAKYILTEKADGANFQVVYLNGERVKFGKRSSYIGDNSDFFNFKDALTDNPNFEAMNREFINYSKYNYDKTIILFGELYGAGINNRVYYGPGRYIRFYDVKEGNTFWPAKNTVDVFKSFNICVPVIAEVTGLKNVLDYNNDFISLLTPEDWPGQENRPNVAEGFVAKPADFDLVDSQGSRFTIKSRNPKFMDRENKKRIFVQLDASLRELADIAKSYVNENRLIDLIAKLGPLTDKKQIGEYMKTFNEDWQADFKSDYAEELSKISLAYSKSEVKSIFKIGGKNAINLIKDHIERYEKEKRQHFLKEIV